MLRLRRSPAKKVKERCERISCITEGVYTIGMCISRFLSEKTCSTWKGEIGIKTKIREREGPSEELSQSVNFLRTVVFARQNSEKITWGDVAPRKMRPQRRMGFGETCLQAREFRFEKSRGVRIRSRFRSINAHDQQKHLKLNRIGYFAKIQKPYCGTSSEWRSAYKRGGTSLRSRSNSNRDCAISRRNAIAWKTLRRPRIFLWVGQRSENHGWPRKGRQLYGKWRTSFVSSFQGLSTSSGSNLSSTSALQDLSTTIPAQERSDGLAPREWRQNKNKKRDGSRDADDRLLHFSEWLEEFTDNLEDAEVHAPAHISQDSDSERPSKVVQNQGSTIFVLTSQNTEIAKSACEPKWQELLKEDALAKLHLEQKSFVTW